MQIVWGIFFRVTHPGFRGGGQWGLSGGSERLRGSYHRLQ